MAIRSDAESAAAARQAAIEAERRRQAEEAARRAAEAAAKAAQEAARAAQAAARAAKFEKSEFSTGNTAALRAGQATATGATPTEPTPEQTAIEKFGQQAHDALTRLGLSTDDLARAGELTVDHLKAAGEAAVNNDWNTALSSLVEAAQVGGGELAQTAIRNLAEQHLSGPAKEILSSEAVVAELFESAPEVVNLLAEGDIGGAVHALAGNEDLRNAVIDAALKDPAFAAQVESLGLTADDLRSAGDALPHLLKAAELVATDPRGAIAELANAAAAAPELVAKGIAAAAARMDPGLARDILTDPDAALAIAQAGPDAITTALNENPVAALRELAGNESLREAVINAALKNEEFAGKLESLGISEDQLKEAGAALPHLIDAAVAFAARDGEAALNALAEAATAAPEVVAEVISRAAGLLDEGNPIRTVLTDPAVTAALADATPDVLRALASGDLQSAITRVADNADLRDAVIDAAFKDPTFASSMERLGLTQDDVKEAGAALRHIFSAVNAAASDDLPGALDALRLAASSAPGLVEKAANKLAEMAPEGSVVRDLLQNTALVQDLLTDRSFHEAVGKMLNGDIAGGLSQLLRNDDIRSQVINTVANNGEVQEALARVGLEASDLRQAGEAAPHVLDAVEAALDNRFEDAMAALGRAAEAAPQLLEKIGNFIYDKLPEDVRGAIEGLGFTREDLAQATNALPSLFNAAKQVIAGDFTGAIDSVLEAGRAAPDLATKLVQGLGSKLPGLAGELLSDPALARTIATNEDLHNGINDILNGNALDGIGAILHNSTARRQALDIIANNEAVAGVLENLGLTAAELQEAGAAAAHIFDAGRALAEGRVNDALTALGEAATSAPELLKKVGEAIYNRLDPELKTKLESLGITPQNIAEAGQALPHLIEAAKQFAQGRPERALEALGEAIAAAPGLVGEAVSRLAAQLPEGPLRTLLSNPAVLGDLLNDTNLREAAQALFSGDLAGAFRELGETLRSGSPVMQHIADALMADPKISAKLKELGIENAADLVQLGGSIGEFFDLVDHIAAGEWGAAVEDLAQIAQSLPSGMRTKIVNALTEKLGLPPEIGQILSGLVDAMQSPAVREAIGAAIEAFKSGNPVEWIKQLANVGQTIASEAPELAIGFLNLLSNLPGPVGAFFGDEQLNRAIVESGSLGHLFGAVEKLASGDVMGALGEIAGALGALITQGEHFSIDINAPWPIPDYHGELPIGQQGIENIGRLIGRFVDAMPDRIKEFIGTKMAEVTAQGGFRSIPVIGPIVGIVSDGVEIVNNIRNGESGLAMAVDIASLAINGASLFPPFAAAAAPLRAVIGIVEAGVEVAEMVQDMGDFGQQFTGMAA